MSEKLKLLPSVDKLLSDEELKPFLARFRREFIRRRLADALEDVRRGLRDGEHAELNDRRQFTALIIRRALERLADDTAPRLRPVINATGIVLHTGLGRAPLAAEAQEQLARVMNGYCNLEVDLESGGRGDRSDHLRALLCELCGAEDALMVNNNAAAVFLALNTLAFGKEAVISRGHLVEIGGSFRLPEVMEKSGVIMREVGTTNKTRLADYERAINANTGVIVAAHTSNYRVLGFTEEVELSRLCRLAHAHGIPVLHDLGAGVLIDFPSLGLPHEPSVQESLKAGADVVTFSGDKVIGGPQAGLIVGKAELLRAIARNPLMRAVRCDKLIYAAMEATLRLYLRNDLLQTNVVLRMLTQPVETVHRRAEALAERLSPAARQRLQASVEPCKGQFGSGALPLETLPSFALVLHSAEIPPDELSRRLRHGRPPVFAYIQDDRVFLDLRTVFDEQLEELAKRIEEISAN